MNVNVHWCAFDLDIRRARQLRTYLVASLKSMDIQLNFVMEWHESKFQYDVNGRKWYGRTAKRVRSCLHWMFKVTYKGLVWVHDGLETINAWWSFTPFIVHPVFRCIQLLGFQIRYTQHVVTGVSQEFVFMACQVLPVNKLTKNWRQHNPNGLTFSRC